ncbi:MAG: hypothetical protein EXS16_06660 [Gemmataceae bacterium]|nr:hypothetical protein [Gemmataceae bacterium]
MILLTEEQGVIVAGEDRPTAIDPHTKTTYVLVREEIYDRIQHLVDVGDWTAEEQLALLAASGKRAGWDAPEMDVYDNYDENRKKLCP